MFYFSYKHPPYKLSLNKKKNIPIPGYYTLTDGTLNVIYERKKKQKKNYFCNRRELYAPEFSTSVLGYFFLVLLQDVGKK